MAVVARLSLCVCGILLACAVLPPTLAEYDDAAVPLDPQAQEMAAEAPAEQASVEEADVPLPEPLVPVNLYEQAEPEEAPLSVADTDQAEVDVAQTTTTYDAIVVGAGLAGLKAAADLKARNYRVLVLEGRGRTGGRVFSTRIGGYNVEGGAQWFHGTTDETGARNPVYDLAANTLRLSPKAAQDTDVLYSSTSASRIRDRAIAGFESTYASFETFANGRSWTNSDSVQTAVDRFLASNTVSTANKQGLKYQLSTNLEQEYGASTKWLSQEWSDEGYELLGADSVLPATTSLSALTQHLASTLSSNILLNMNVINIAYSSTGVRVTARNSAGVSSVYSAKFVIVTVPLGVLKARGSAFFSPALSSAKQTAIRNLGSGLLNKVILQFPATYIGGPFAEPAYWIGRLPKATTDTGYWQEFYNLRKATQTPLLVAFNAGEPAVNAENSMTDAAMVASVMAQLRIWYPNIPSPESFLVTRWWNDPFSFGAYSYYAVGCTGSERRTLGTNVQNRVFFAGEHISRNLPSTMQGAFVTGQKAASDAAALHTPSG